MIFKLKALNECMDDCRPFDALQREDIYISINAGHDLVCGVSIPQLPKITIGKGRNVAAVANRVEDFVEAVGESDGPAFELGHVVHGRPILKKNTLARWYGTIMHCGLWVDNHYDFSEEVQIVHEGLHALKFEAHRLKLPESRESKDGLFGYEYFNVLVEWLREKLKDKNYLNRRRRRREQARRHYDSGVVYINKLFDRHARLLVLRLDFGYQDWTKKENGFVSYKSLNDARGDLKRFFNNRRSNRLFDNMVGYIWKLEHGTTKGFHFHLIFFFDGSKVQKDAYLAMRLGEYWEKVITKGKGCHHNCNLHKSEYRRLGIGQTDHNDTERRANLMLALAYMTKADQYLRVRTEDARIFGTGVVKARLSAVGRPRRGSDADGTSPDVDNGQNLDDDSLPETN